MSQQSQQSQGRDSPDRRRVQILEAGLQTFSRHGYRKASLDDVARLAGISRAGLYLHFPSKAALFRSALEYEFDRALMTASQSLDNQDIPPAERVTAALDVWLGRYVGSTISRDVDALAEENGDVRADMFDGYHVAFEQRFAEALNSMGIPETTTAPQVSARLAARVLIAVARGLKDHATTREEFREVVSAAAGLVLSRPSAHSP